MATLQNAMLCNAASVEASGLVSMLGAFVDHFAGPAFPIQGQLWLVARVEWDTTDFDLEHHLTIAVTHPDGEQIARVEGSTIATTPPAGAFDPEMPLGGTIAVPLVLSFRREGRYTVLLSLDGDVLWESPLRVRLQPN